MGAVQNIITHHDVLEFVEGSSSTRKTHIVLRNNGSKQTVTLRINTIFEDKQVYSTSSEVIMAKESGLDLWFCLQPSSRIFMHGPTRLMAMNLLDFSSVGGERTDYRYSRNSTRNRFCRINTAGYTNGTL